MSGICELSTWRMDLPVKVGRRSLRSLFARFTVLLPSHIRSQLLPDNGQGHGDDASGHQRQDRDVSRRHLDMMCKFQVLDFFPSRFAARSLVTGKIYLGLVIRVACYVCSTMDSGYRCGLLGSWCGRISQQSVCGADGSEMSERDLCLDISNARKLVSVRTCTDLRRSFSTVLAL